MSTGGGRLVDLTERLRSDIHCFTDVPGVDASSALRRLDELERLAKLLARVAVDSHEELEHRVRDLSMLRKLAETIVSVFDLDRFCDGLLRIVGEEMPNDASALHLFDRSSGRLVIRAFQGDFDRSACDLFANRCSLGVSDVSAPTRLEDASDHPELGIYAREANWRSVLAVPIHTLGRPVGVLFIAHSRPGRFNEEHERALVPLAELAGVAIRHVQLTDESVTASDSPIPLPGSDTRRALSRREKLSALNKLAGVVAHEFNNPMSYVLSSLGRAREDAEQLTRLLRPTGPLPSPERDPRRLVDELRELLDEIGEGLGRVQRLAHDLQGLVRGSSDQPEALDPNRVVETAILVARAETKPGLSLEANLKPVPRVCCRRLQLMQALFGLIQNALEAIDDEGAVRVSTSQAGGRVRIDVADDGPGIPADRMDRIFQPFYSTKPQAGGMGLPVAREIVESHGGTLTVSSDPGGAVFSVSLPIHEDGPVEPEPA